MENNGYNSFFSMASTSWGCTVYLGSIDQMEHFFDKQNSRYHNDPKFLDGQV